MPTGIEDPRFIQYSQTQMTGSEDPLRLARLQPGWVDPPWVDSIFLAGLQSPGMAVLRGAGTPRKWDVREPYGFSGGSSIYIGQSLCEFDCDIYLWKPEHWGQWNAFAKATLQKEPLGVAAHSLSIWHPALVTPPLNIDQVAIKNCTQFEQVDETGLWMCTISFLEFRKPKQALSKPLEGPPGAPTVVKPPVDEDLIKIAERNQQIVDLLAGK